MASTAYRGPVGAPTVATVARAPRSARASGGERHDSNGRKKNVPRYNRTRQHVGLRDGKTIIATTRYRNAAEGVEPNHRSVAYHVSFTALMYNTLFPRTNASPYLFFNWPLTYSCRFATSRRVFFFF